MGNQNGRIRLHTRCAPVLRLIVLASLSVLVSACSVIYTLRPEKAVEDKINAVPVPAGATVLNEHHGSSFGSESGCVASYTRRLYGTYDSFNEVVSFYRTRLPAHEWAETETRTGAIWFSSTGHFRLAVSSSANGSGAPAELVLEARRTYPTVYYLGLTYMIDPVCYQH
jgi:hypothetical protein